MSKKNDDARKARTHFEQVPLKVVKQIVGDDMPEAPKAGTGDTAKKATPPRPSGTAAKTGR